MTLEQSTLTEPVTLNNGVSIPRIGLGVYESPQGEVTREAVRAALACGYRHVDTARVYRNELDVHEAVVNTDVPRTDVFVTTKLWNDHHGYDEALRAFDVSHERLGGVPIDLFLIHWPVPEKRRETWRALERIYEQGLARAIGVSNYAEHHMIELLARCNVPPAVNQIELSPFYRRDALVALCAREGVAIEAYSPLTRGVRLADPRLARLADKHRATPAQILIRWGLGRGYVVLPKSVRASRIEENFAALEVALDEEDWSVLDGLDEQLITCWDPTPVP